MAETELLGGAIVLRPDEKGRFDELLMMQDGACTVHAEMMDHNCLWIGFYPPGSRDRVVMYIDITTKGRLRVRAHEDR